MNKFVKYVLFALITSALNVGAYYVCYRFICHNIIVSNVIAYAVSISSQFIINKKIVFKSNNYSYSRQIILFLIVKLIAFMIDTSVLYICIKTFKIDQLIAKIIANCSTTISNYSLNNKVVFK